MEDLLDKQAVCRLLGDIHPSTLWRWIKAGRFPPPIHIGPQVRRWSESQCQAAMWKMFEAQQGHRPKGYLNERWIVLEEGDEQRWAHQKR
jgi:predicted DNA-binding transcriptional regulator AlpA